MVLNDTIRIDFSKNTKPVYYIKALLKLFLPSVYYRKKYSRLFENLSKEEQEYIDTRVNYYNKLNKECTDINHFSTIKSFMKYEKKRTYFFDLAEYLKYFDGYLKISYLFGDIVHIPATPTILKSRPINGNNSNSILMNLDKVRHFIFLNDKVAFQNKKNMLMWRGKAHQIHRKTFLDKFYMHPLCDVGQIVKNSDKNPNDVEWVKKKLSLKKQLQYKFILAIEGNDVASNLKWIMSSNSLAFMVKPKYETWFMEGQLIPNYHYVLLKDDYSDLEEKILYYSRHQNEALQIIKNAHAYIEPFKNKRLEDIISISVLEKYFSFLSLKS